MPLRIYRQKKKPQTVGKEFNGTALKLTSFGAGFAAHCHQFLVTPYAAKAPWPEAPNQAGPVSLEIPLPPGAWSKRPGPEQ